MDPRRGASEGEPRAARQAAPPPVGGPGAPGAPGATPSGRRMLLTRAVLFPEIYVWYVFMASLDVMLTWVILHLEGREVNLLADWIIRRWELPGVVAFKFGTVLLVVIICEVVGRVRQRTGRLLAAWSVGLTAVPVVVAVVQLVHALTTRSALPAGG